MTAPTSLVVTPHDVVHAVLQRLVTPLELDVECLGKILPEVVRRAGLERAAVAHQCLDRIRPGRTRELLAVGFLPVDDRDGEHRFANVLVEREDLERLLLRLGLGLVRGMAFLPEELGRPEERARHLLPPHDVRPLVDEHRQVTPRLDPLLVHHAEDRLGGGPHDEPLVELLGAALGHPRHLRREALDVLGFAEQQALGNQQREVRVHVAARLDAAIQLLLNQLPDGVAVRPDDHEALDRRIVGQFRLPDDVQIPA